MGSDRASSGPLVEAVKHWDIRATDASEDSFRRQILNYIGTGGKDETAGLLKGPGGDLVLDHGRPVLDTAPDAQALDQKLPRANGKKGCEFLHESGLFRSHSKAFEDLNMMVRFLELEQEKQFLGEKLDQMHHMLP